jgi:methyltransferase (TIGR00027 family)
MEPAEDAAAGAPASGLQNVSETALWVAAYRAEESERRDALFHDPFARRLAGRRGFDLLDAMPRGRKLSWPMVARTVVFDELIRQRVERGADVVVNLAAGLDARPYRMALPSRLLWIEVDLPPMIEYKSRVLAGETPVCALERVPLDLADRTARRDLFARIAERGASIVIVTEGLLIYLAEEQVAELAIDLAEPASFRSWVTDLASPGLLKMLQPSFGREVERAGAPFRFAPQDGPAFFTRFGWKVASVEEALRAAARIERLPRWMRIFAWLPSPKRWNPKRVWSGLLALERA